VVFTEASLEIDGREALSLMVRKAGLADEVGPEAWRSFVSRTPEIPAPLLDRMHPWAAVITVSVAEMTPTGPQAASTVEPMDRSVQNLATARKIPMKYVETLEEQGSILAGFNNGFIEGLKTPRDLAAEQASIRALDAVCRTGRIEDSKLLLGEDAALKEVMFDTRNRAWLPKLLPDLNAGGAFVAVGAGHMLGPVGLLALLEAEGFAVRQATSDRPIQPSPAFTSRPVPPPFDAERAALIHAHYQPVAERLCAPNNPIRQCFFSDDASCSQTVDRDLHLCADQNSATWETSGTPGIPELTKVLTCVAADATVEGMLRPDLEERPQCAGFAAALKKAK
jgi:TraB/PrgY/gumN family